MAWADSQNCGGDFQWFSHPRWLIKISQSGKGVWAVSAPQGWITQPLKKDGSQSFLSPVDAFLSFGPQKGRFHHAFECFHFYRVWHSLTYIQTQSLEGGSPFLWDFLRTLTPFFYCGAQNCMLRFQQHNQWNQKHKGFHFLFIFPSFIFSPSLSIWQGRVEPCQNHLLSVWTIF